MVLSAILTLPEPYGAKFGLVAAQSVALAGGMLGTLHFWPFHRRVTGLAPKFREGSKPGMFTIVEIRNQTPEPEPGFSYGVAMKAGYIRQRGTGAGGETVAFNFGFFHRRRGIFHGEKHPVLWRRTNPARYRGEQNPAITSHNNHNAKSEGVAVCFRIPPPVAPGAG